MLSSACLSLAVGQPSATADTVLHVAAWTAGGERIQRIWVSVSSLDGREKFAGSGRDVNLTVPAGEFMLQVAAPGFQTSRQLFRAYQPAIFRSAVLPVAWVHGQATPGLTGSVRNYDGDIRNLRIRLMALGGDELREAVPAADGSFTFPVDGGPYLLVTVADVENGTSIMDCKPIRILRSEAVIIDLKGKHGTLIPR